jgi:hypothetical protein
MKLIYMECTLRLIASVYPEAIEAIELAGELKNTDLTRYIVIEDGENG